MKKFIKFFAISIILSGIILTIAYLFSFTPLDTKNGSFFSNGFITGMILLLIGIFRIRTSGYDHQVISLQEAQVDVSKVNSNRNSEDISTKIFKKGNGDVYAYFIAGAINLILSFLI